MPLAGCGEVAEVAGWRFICAGYHNSLGGNEAPVIDGMTGDQRFYLGWAQVWRRNYREANLRARLLTDPIRRLSSGPGSCATSTPGTRRSTSSRARSFTSPPRTEYVFGR